MLDTSELSLSTEDESLYESLVREEKRAKLPEAEKVKQLYIQTRASELVYHGMDEKDALLYVTSSLQTGELYGVDELHFQTHGTVTVAEVLTDPKKFHSCSLADPFTPNFNKMTVAIFYADSLMIWSFARGGTKYYLKHAPPESCTKEALNLKVSDAINNAVLASDNAAKWLVDNSDVLDKTASELLIDTVINQLGLKGVKAALRADMKAIRNSVAQQQRNEYMPKIQRDFSKSLDPMIFPDVNRQTGQLLATKGNLISLLNGYDISLHYDVISKQQYLGLGEGIYCADLAENAKLAEIESLCGLNSLPFKCMDYLIPLFAVNAINPVTNYLKQTKWDGKDYVTILRDMVTVTPESKPLFDVAFLRWLIQCVAAADGAESTPNKQAKAKYEHCLVFAGEQGVRKTTFFGDLIPKQLKPYFADGMHLDPANKDSLKLVICNWIVELGEIDATFQRGDIARLKAFMSRTSDAMRLPYDKTESQFQRRTSFCGSVNDRQFLTDKTGSRRYWVVETLALPTLSEIELKVDIDQMLAQAWHLYMAGEIWWADDDMKALVDASGERHASDNAVLDALEYVFDLDNLKQDKGKFIAAGSLPSMLDMQKSHNLSRDIRQALKSKNIERVKNSVDGFWLVTRESQV